MRHLILLILGLMPLLLPSGRVAAQPLTIADHAWHGEHERPNGENMEPGLWRSALNPAGLAQVTAFAPDWIRFGVSNVEGDLYRPQHPTGLRAFQFDAGGTAELEGWHLHGGAHFTRRMDRRVEWSAVSDPHDRMAFAWADSIGGRWYRNHVGLEAAIGSPRFAQRLYGGVHLRYDIGQGARRNNPRPLYRTRNLDLRPGIAVRLGDHHQLGALLHLTWMREVNEFGKLATDDPFVYTLRGLGTFERERIVRGERTTSGTRLGGGLQYAGQRSDWRWDVSALYKTGVDSIREGIADPTFGGRHATQEAHLRGAVRRSGTNLSLDLRVEAGWWKGRGTDPIFRSVNFIAKNSHAQVQFGMRPKNPARSREWSAGVRVRLDDLSRRDVVRQTKWATTTIGTGLHGRIRQSLTSRFALHLHTALRHVRPISTGYRAGNPTRLTDDLVVPDYDYYASTRWGGHLQVGLGWRPSEAASDRVRLSLHGARSATSADWIGDGRRSVRLTLSVFAQ